jgi:hypothetical protein
VCVFVGMCLNVNVCVCLWVCMRACVCVCVLARTCVAIPAHIHLKFMRNEGLSTLILQCLYECADPNSIVLPGYDNTHLL